MQIRIEGKRSEMDGVVEKLKTVFDVKDVSKFYLNRGFHKNSVTPDDYGRVYVTLDGDNYERFRNGVPF